MWQPHTTLAPSTVVYHPNWLEQRSRHCSLMHFHPVHFPWLPGYTDVAQAILVILTMVGFSLYRPHITPYIRSSKYTLMVLWMGKLNNWVEFAPVSSEMFNCISLQEGTVPGIHRPAHLRDKASGLPHYFRLLVPPWVDWKLLPSTLSRDGEQCMEGVSALISV